MITRFDCPGLLAMLVVLLLHKRVARDVRRYASGFIAVVSHHDWRTRTVLSISLWRDLDSVYSMGQVDRHVAVTRIPRRLGIATRCGVFCYVGGWLDVMFGPPAKSMSPLAEAVPPAAVDVSHEAVAAPATIT